MATPGLRLRELVRADPPDARAVANHLDGLDPPERLEAIQSLGGIEVQSRLYAAAASARRVELADLVPEEAPPLVEVVFQGKNSLPAFTLFQKRFCRPPPQEGRDELWGYNEQPMRFFTGPGYFVVRVDPEYGATIDYREVPPRGCPGWPAVKSNDRGLSRLVYMDMVDRLRRVADGVVVGRAVRRGVETQNYFVVCRA